MVHNLRLCSETDWEKQGVNCDTPPSLNAALSAKQSYHTTKLSELYTPRSEVTFRNCFAIASRRAAPPGRKSLRVAAGPPPRRCPRSRSACSCPQERTATAWCSPDDFHDIIRLVSLRTTSSFAPPILMCKSLHFCCTTFNVYLLRSPTNSVSFARVRSALSHRSAGVCSLCSLGRPLPHLKFPRAAGAALEWLSAWSGWVEPQRPYRP